MSTTAQPPTSLRIDLAEQAPRAQAAMARFSGTVDIDHQLGELVRIRASQINGCAFCIDLHWRDARASGESEERLYMLDAWRESPLYDDRERAALALAEAITLITDGRVPDEVWEQAAAEFPPAELAQLVFAITAINAWNRLAITSRMTPGAVG